MRELLSNTIMSLGSNNESRMETDCEKFGMTWGCKEDCPVLQDGKCDIYASVTEFLGYE